MSKEELSIKEELEILRGEPVEVFTGDPLDIPCNETSDVDLLCKNPVVSVCMITYNHESYIRQSIEGVMMQKTDFEFELVIGEDCSTDATREICFEYQKCYPDKIRVLWCDHNLYRNPHQAGGNSERNLAHCRGEYIALCEGDDYWIDTLKLQKQVDVMRRNSNVGLCFCGARILDQRTGDIVRWNHNYEGFEPGLIPSLKYVLFTIFGKEPLKGWGCEAWQMTATFMVRKDVIQAAERRYDIFQWKLSIGDAVLCIGCGSLADVYYIGDDVAVYRRTNSGVTLVSGGKCALDTLIARMYYVRKFLNLDYCDLPDAFVLMYILWGRSYLLNKTGGDKNVLERWLHGDVVECLARRPAFRMYRALDFDPDRIKRFDRWIYYFAQFISGCTVSDRLIGIYKLAGCNREKFRRKSLLKYIFNKVRGRT